ncbi:MAG: PepSY-associated TM helix domain-containing protein [Thiobacillus sp.]|nr:PepSY-associated TM helix domain-containing protein [Thiobacillus sp.]
MKVRSVVFNLHLYTGLAVGLLLVLSGLTGSLLVFREEIEGLVYPELMKTAPRDERVPVQAVLEAVGRAYPQDRPFSIRLPRTPQQTYLVRMNGAHDLLVYADPYSGKILGALRQEDTFTGWISLLHTQLLSGERGETLLGIGAMLLVCMGVTGIILWWPRHGKISPGFKIRWPAHWKKVNFDLHRASGIYAALFLLITAFTGVSLVFNKNVAGLINAVTQSPARTAPPLSEPLLAGMPTPSLDMLLQQADHIPPATVITWINFPQTPRAPWVVRKKLPQESHPNGRNFIYLDQYTGRVLQVENTLEAPLGTRINNVLYLIHIGVIGGTPTRILQVAVGLSPTVLFVTGFVRWKNRRKGKR